MLAYTNASDMRITRWNGDGVTRKCTTQAIFINAVSFTHQSFSHGKSKVVDGDGGRSYSHTNTKSAVMSGKVTPLDHQRKDAVGPVKMVSLFE